jgi:hypothetical protein
MSWVKSVDSVCVVEEEEDRRIASRRELDQAMMGAAHLTHRCKDVEMTSVGRNRQSPPAVSGTLDAAKRAAKIAELRELMEKVERRWQAPERSKSQRGPPRSQRR